RVGEQTAGECSEARVVERRAVNGDALARLVEVGRGEEQGVRAGRAQNGFDHGGGRAFAFRAGDMDGVARVGAAEAVEQLADVLEAPAARLGDVAGALVAAVGEQAADGLDVDFQVGGLVHRMGVYGAHAAARFACYGE